MIKVNYKSILLYSSILFTWSVGSTIVLLKLLKINLGINQEKLFNSKLTEGLVGIFVIPIVETLIFQTLIFYLCEEMIKDKKIKFFIFIIIASILFGFSHFYNYYFIVSALVSGIILSYSFLDFYKRFNIFSATIGVSIVHSLSNFLIYIIKLIF